MNEADIAEALWTSWDPKQRLRWWISKRLGRTYPVEVGEPGLLPGSRKETLAMLVRAARQREEYTRHTADPPPLVQPQAQSSEEAQK